MVRLARGPSTAPGLRSVGVTAVIDERPPVLRRRPEGALPAIASSLPPR